MYGYGLSAWKQDETGAVAATVALSLFALVAAGGIAFDYARLATMDTELQNAADHAALAAATQLDGEAGATQRAEEAANNLVANDTLFANDGGDRNVTIATVAFYQDKAKNQLVTRDDASTTDDALANYVEVTVGARTAVYALTPVVGALNSGAIDAKAFAGLGSSICKVPPLMFCNPLEPLNNTDVYLTYDADGEKGVGNRLVANDSYTPGSFGFLETNFGSGANALLAALGWNTPKGDCAAVDGVEIKNGMNASVMDGFNTRFDIDTSGNSCPSIGGQAGVCSPSVNVRKDLVRGNACGITGNGWEENDASSTDFASKRYRPTSASVYPSTVTPQIMGHPRDLCHAFNDVGDCVLGRVGDGRWDINAYWRSNYGADYNNEISSADPPVGYGSQPKGYPTRYQVYQYEIDHLSTIGTPKPGGAGKAAYSQPVAGKCLATASSPYGIVPGGIYPDRRRISAAALNCNALKAKYGNINNTELEVTTFVDLFLVEPSYSRSKCKGGGTCATKYSDKTDIYVEVIGATKAGLNATVGQVTRRDVPYLIE